MMESAAKAGPAIAAGATATAALKAAARSKVCVRQRLDEHNKTRPHVNKIHFNCQRQTDFVIECKLATRPAGLVHPDFYKI